MPQCACAQVLLSRTGQSATERQHTESSLPKTSPADSQSARAGVSNRVRIAKSDDEKHLVFGWAMVAVQKDGKHVVDHDDQWCEPEDVEEAAYNFVLNAANGGVSGEDHDDGYEPDAYLIESVAFTAEKLEAMGMDPGVVDLGHWVGLYIPDDDAYVRVKSGEKAMLSVDGWALEHEEMPPGEFVRAA